MAKKTLLIIGAGASGLMAAKELSDDFDITILEAAPHIGGRINSIQINNEIIEAGAEFIHGRLPTTFKLLKAAGIEVQRVQGKFYRKENNLFIEQRDIFPCWDELLEKMKSVKKDITMRQFLQKFYGKASDAAFRETISSYTEGFDVADPGKASVKKLYEEWNAEAEENYRILSGYSSLMDFLKEKSGCKLFTGKKVNLVKWEKDNITAITDNGENFHANKLLVTIPVSILCEPSHSSFINFIPSFDEYVNAANNIGFGDVVKVIFRFKEPFWQQDASFFFSDEKYFPTWWTQSPSQLPLLTGWSGGPPASVLSGMAADEIISTATIAVSKIFEIEIEKLHNYIVYSRIFNWKKNEFAGGAYSYETIYSTLAKKVLNTPVSNTIFFAGEALYTGKHPGTVEAALESGRQTAKLIKKI